MCGDIKWMAVLSFKFTFGFIVYELLLLNVFSEETRSSLTRRIIFYPRVNYARMPPRYLENATRQIFLCVF